MDAAGILVSIIVVLAAIGLTFLFVDSVPLKDPAGKGVKIVAVTAGLIYAVLLLFGAAPAIPLVHR